MSFKRVFILLLAMTILMSGMGMAETEAFVQVPPSSDNEGSSIEDIPALHYYQGGIVSRSFAKGDSASSDLLNLSYVLANAPYIKLDTPSNWEVVISGGAAPYCCDALLLYQHDLSLDEYGDPWSLCDYFELDEYTFDYTFSQSGRYYWEFQLQDANGQSLVFQTRIFETYSSADESDETTVAGKVNSIISEYITDDMSDYTRARVLHDWLIGNADYDLTYTRYDASGVLLYGSGVCDSYARAYQMLLAAAGIESIIVTGKAGSSPDSYENHGWNLVKLDGSWYHIDCTWDDPPSGGMENHAYFCLTDEEMAVDHIWNKPENQIDYGMLVPDAEGGQYSEMISYDVHYDFAFSSASDYGEKLDRFVADKNYQPVIALYTGESIDGILDSLVSVTGEKMQNYMNQMLLASGAYPISVNGHFYIIEPDWLMPSSYIRIDESAFAISVNVSERIIPSSFGPNSSGFTWVSSDPSIATVTGKTEGTDTLYAVVKGVSAGSCTITVTGKNGGSDSFTVNVLPAYQPDFNLSLTETEGGVQLAWNHVPGVTFYEVHRVVGNLDVVIATASTPYTTITSDRLPNDVLQMICVVGIRNVNGSDVLSYRSNSVPYGEQVIRIEYDAVLPADLVSVGENAFAATNVKAVYISDGTETIASGAFANCNELRYVRIPGSVTDIAADAFSNCTIAAVVVEQGSYAEAFFTENYPNLTRIH